MQKIHAAMRDVVMTPGGHRHEGAHPRRRGRRQDRHGADRRADGGSNRRWRADSRDHAWFIAFAPVEAPRSRSSCWSSTPAARRHVAAPIAKQVLEHYFTRDADPQRRQGVAGTCRARDDDGRARVTGVAA